MDICRDGCWNVCGTRTSSTPNKSPHPESRNVIVKVGAKQWDPRSDTTLLIDQDKVTHSPGALGTLPFVVIAPERRDVYFRRKLKSYFCGYFVTYTSRSVSFPFPSLPPSPVVVMERTLYPSLFYVRRRSPCVRVKIVPHETLKIKESETSVPSDCGCRNVGIVRMSF